MAFIALAPLHQARDWPDRLAKLLAFPFVDSREEDEDDDLEVRPKTDKNFWPVREYVVWFANPVSRIKTSWICSGRGPLDFDYVRIAFCAALQYCSRSATVCFSTSIDEM